MKHYLILLIVIFGFHHGNSQDVIITKAGDTINCKITRVTDEFIHFSVFDQGGILLVRSRIPVSQIKQFKQGESKAEKQSPIPPAIREEDRFILDEFDPSSFRLSLNTGYTYQFGGYEGWTSSYKKQVKSLWNFGSELHYFLSDDIGVGAKFNYIFTKAADEFDPQIYTISSIQDERIRFTYIALSFMYRNFLYDDQVVHYFIAGGIIKYRTDGLIDGNSFYENGDTFGFVLGVTYDFLLSENFGVGVGAEVNIARLTEIETGGAIQPVDFSLTRFDLTLGLRLFK